MDIDLLVKSIEKEFISYSNPLIAKKQEKYMRNNFRFFGLTANQRRTIQNPFVKSILDFDEKKFNEFIIALWNKEHRDFQYFSQELVYFNHYNFKCKDINIFEYMIINKSWWDTIDFVSPKILGKYFEIYPKKIEKTIQKWLNSNNIWLQRSCLLFQLKYKNKLNKLLLEKIINSLRNSNEFFINKAIGWILREYGKTNKNWVINFIKETELNKLSVREGLKYLKY
tara:strand:+ start:3234 stop:3911 length:678 start_codon:yes stop_codon:yes gene_type:complete